MSTNIITDFQINNNLTITDNNLKLQTDGTTGTLDISGNLDVSSNMIVRGFIGVKTETPVVSLDISANDALRIPMGDSSSRPDYTAIDCSGCIRYNTETTQFEGFSPSGQSWIGLGGVIDIDQDTKILAELNPDEDKLRFYTAGGQQMIINEYGDVGIGTDSPDTKLQVIGDFHVEGTSDAWTSNMGKGLYFRFHNDNAYGYIQSMDRTNNTYYGLQFDTIEYKFRTNGIEKVRIKENGNVGIGETSPDEKLVVNGGSIKMNTWNNQFMMGDTNWGFKNTNSGSNYHIDCRINGTAAQGPNRGFRIHNTYNNEENYLFTVTTAGNVGIGRTSPGAKLEVFHKFSTATHTTLPIDSDNISSNETVGLFLSKQPYNNTSYRYGLAMGTLSNGYSYIQSMSNTSTGRVLLLNPNSAGNVGIGTDSPKAKLQVNGSIVVNTYSSGSQGGTAGIFFREANSPGGSSSSDLYNCSIMNYAHNETSNYTPDGISINGYDGVSICTGSNDRNERMRITRDGNMGIGTDSPTDLLTVGEMTSNTGGTTSMSILAPGEDADSILYFGTAKSMDRAKKAAIIAEGRTNYSRSNLHFCLDDTVDNATTYNASISNSRMTILSNGNVGIGITSPAEKLHVSGNTVVTGDITAYYSDERLKTFKGKITDPLAKIKQINGYYFVENELAKSLGYDNDKLQVGVSAQEVEKVLPEIVTKAPIDNEYKTVWYQKLTPLLIEGMKEQQTQIEQQQTQIQSLQEQIDELKELIKNI